MIVVASANGRVGMDAAVEVLRRGGSALDAVEAGIRLVEDNPEDHSVGTGGLPNLLGEVELDASIMDGRARAAGAVAAIKGYPNPISVARRVMSDLPHVLLAGEGAARFAQECGFEAADLLTEQARRVWRQQLEETLPADALPGQVRWQETLTRWAQLATDPERAGGTVNFLVQDSAGDIAAGVSTSGWAWKYPGRVGDSPIIAAGCYADNRYGAAACTGRGEMAIRAATAHSVVLAMRHGLTVEEAVAEAQRDLWTLDDPFYGGLHIIAIDRDGRPAAASNREVTFIWQRPEMADCVEEARTQIDRPN